MKQPYLSFSSQKRQMQTAFGGLNHTDSCQDGELYDMRNMTGDFFPTASNRKKRGIYPYPSDANIKAKALIGKDALCYVSDTDLFINNEKVNDFMLDEDTEKSLISMGAYILVFPDKKYINTKDTSDKGLIEAEKTVSTSGEGAVSVIKAVPCKRDGSDFTYVASDTVPETITNGMYWIDTSTTPASLKQYSATSLTWTTVQTTYFKLVATNINYGRPFKEGDGITVSLTASSTLPSGLANAIQGATVIQSTDDNKIVLVGMISGEYADITSVTISRKMPDFDYIVESNNRLWACKYGLTNDNEVVNQIYASALGDFKNWNVFEGIASDSYFANLGSDGEFTGAAVVQGYPIFFKENCFHKVYGQDINNTQIISTVCNGIQRGSDRSTAIVNNILFYKGVNGIYAYDGSLPVMISEKLGTTHYVNAVGGSLDNKYYVSMTDTETNSPIIVVFDTTKNTWHLEDNTAVKQFCRNGNELYYITETDDYIHTVNGSGNIENAPIKWSMESGLLGMATPNKKFVNTINVRVSFAEGTFVHFFAEYDGEGVWHHLYSQEGHSLRSVNIPLRLRRCDHFRLKISGEGDCKIFSISRDYTEGSTL